MKNRKLHLLLGLTDQLIRFMDIRTEMYFSERRFLTHGEEGTVFTETEKREIPIFREKILENIREVLQDIVIPVQEPKVYTQEALL